MIIPTLQGNNVNVGIPNMLVYTDVKEVKERRCGVQGGRAWL